MNKLDSFHEDYFIDKFKNNFLCFFIIQNADYQLNSLIFHSMDTLNLFEDFKDDAHDISPKIIIIKNHNDFIDVLNFLNKNKRVSFLFSQHEADLVLDELKKLLEIKVNQFGKFLFRFYDNYVFDFTLRTISENGRNLNLGRYISEWYWSDLKCDIFYISQLDFSNSLQPLVLSKEEFNKVNELIYPFNLIPKFKDYEEYAQFETNNIDDFDWYSEVVNRIDLAKKRNLSHKKDIELYAILSFGLGESVFDKHPLDKALAKTIEENILLEEALEEVKLEQLRS